MGGFDIVQHMHFPAQLGQPGGRHVGAHAVVVHQHQARPAHAGEMIGLLHQLAAGGGACEGQVPGLEFFRCAHVEQVSAAPGLLLPALQVGERGAIDLCLVGDTTCIGGGQ
ncbi:hypothetical protein D3C73_960640 [compost metagenome]